MGKIKGGGRGKANGGLKGRERLRVGKRGNGKVQDGQSRRVNVGKG